MAPRPTADELELARAKFIEQPVHVALLESRRVRHGRILFGLTLAMLGGAIALAIPHPVGLFDMWIAFSVVAGACAGPVWLHRIIVYALARRKEARVAMVWKHDSAWALAQLGSYHAAQSELEVEHTRRRARYGLYAKLSTVSIVLGLAAMIALAASLPPTLSSWHLAILIASMLWCLSSCVGMLVYSSRHDRLLEDHVRRQVERDVVRREMGEDASLGALSAADEDFGMHGALSELDGRHEGAR